MSTIIVFIGVLLLVLLAIRSIMKEKKCNPNGCFGCTKCGDFKNLKEMYYNDYH